MSTASEYRTGAIEALTALSVIDPIGTDAWLRVQILVATAQVSASLAQAAAIEDHTKVISTFMASTMTPTQAKLLVKALAGFTQ